MKIFTTILTFAISVSHAYSSHLFHEPRAELLKVPVYRYMNATLVKDHKLVKGDLWVKGGKIVDPQDLADYTEDMVGQILAPGYIDIQINGGFGVDFSTNPEDWKTVARELPKYGVTAFCPTLVTLDAGGYKKCIPILQPRTKKGNKGPKGLAAMLGIHLEGPFLSPAAHGAHNEELIVEDLNGETLEQFYGTLKGVRIITMAPENPTLTCELVKNLKKRGIIVSAGHTRADKGAMYAALLRGVRLTTHLFNAMTPLHHREPGVVGVVLERPASKKEIRSFSIIADGIHVDSTIVNMAHRCNPKGLILVTDAMQALGCEDGDHQLGSMTVHVEEGKATIKDTKTLAGSVLSMDQAVRNLREFAYCSIVEAIESATLKPARLLGINQQRGTLNVGSNADFLVLDGNLKVLRTYISGELVYLAKKK